MSDFVAFPSTSRNLGLPFLFAGQSQKEFFVNQSLALIDSLLTPSINGALTTPPADAQDGDVYRIVAPSQGAWTDRDNELAVRIGGHWHFVAPVQGMMIYDRATGTYVCFTGTWHSESVPASVSGGATIDVEARAVLAQVIDALAKLGLVAATPT